MQNQTNQPDEAQKHRLQNELMINESDFRKKNAEKIELEAELKKLNREKDLLVVQINDKKARFEKLSFETVQLSQDIKSLKKKIQGIIN